MTAPGPLHGLPTASHTLEPQSEAADQEFQSTPGRRSPPPYLPPELLSLIDAPRIWKMSKEAILEHLDRVPDSFRAHRYLSDDRKLRRLASAMMASERPGRAVRLLCISHSLGHALKMDIYEAVAQLSAAAGHWDLVIRVLRLCKRQTGGSSVRLLNWHVQALVELRDFARLRHVFIDFTGNGLQPDRRTYHLAIRGHLQNRDLSMATRLLQLMQGAGFPVNASTQAIIVSAYRSLGSDPTVRAQALRGLQTADSRTATYILNALAQDAIDAGDHARLTSVLLLFDQEKLTISSMPLFYPIGDSVADEDIDHLADDDVIEPSLSGFSPDVATYTILLNYMARLRDLECAVFIQKQMLDAGIVPDADAVAALIRVCFSVNDTVSAVHLVKKTCWNNPKAQRCLQDLALSAGSPTNPPFLSFRVKASVHIFNALMAGVLATQGHDNMYLIVRAMQAHSIQPDGHTVEIFLTYLDKSGSANAMEILEILNVLQPSKKHLSVGQLRVVFRAILSLERKPVARSGWHTPADAVLRNWKAKLYSLLAQYTEGSPSPADDALEDQGEEPAESLLRPLVHALTSRRVNADRAILALEMKHIAVTGGDMRAARDIFQGMLNKGMHPNKYHYGALMEGYVLAGDMATAEAVMHAAVMAGIRPGVVMYTILISGYALHREPDEATRTLQAMLVAGVRLDIPAVDAITSAYFGVGGYAIARRILLDLWPSVAPFPEALRGAPLKQLIEEFRALQTDGRKKNGKLTKQEAGELRWKLRTIVQSWREGRNGREGVEKS
ncbi:hypothetical protein EWM64_g3529 [Hericium alpestre]|uniref:Pentacotripeptide-repeat region of PRORP domain-containing protein n=1 Tax=Hericium alpestre TaxID=135208 RepID=A0A4Z0A1C4_9AGAM|nr:hypothetical protein EWM64_g3529 [Hericium alpestre]